MRYLNILPRHKKYQFGIIYNSLSWCRHDGNCGFNNIYRNVFLYDIKTHSVLFAVETLGTTFTWFSHERYIYKFNYKWQWRGYFKAQNESSQMTYAVKTVDNLFHGVDIRDI